MKSKHTRAPLNSTELKRLTELEFFYFVKYLEVQFGRGIKLYDIIEVLSFLSENDMTLMKSLTADILMNVSILRPASKEEYALLLWRLNYSAKTIYEKIGTRPNDLYNEIEQFVNQTYVPIQPKTNENVYQSIERFMRPTKMLANWDTRHEGSPIL